MSLDRNNDSRGDRLNVANENNMRTLSMKETQLSPPGKQQQPLKDAPPSPGELKRYGMYSGTDIDSNLCKSEEDLSKEPLSDSEDDECEQNNSAGSKTAFI